jgi:uncharacterized membrane protein
MVDRMTATTGVPDVPTDASAGNGRERSARAPAWLRDALHALETDERLDRVAATLTPSAERLRRRAGPALRGDWLGHALHPLLTDLPLGCWIGASLLDLTAGRSGRGAARRLVGLGLVAVVPTGAAGLVDWSEVDDPAPRRVGAAHAVGNSTVALLYFLSWRARRRGRHRAGVGLGLAGGGLAWVTGYLGGHLSFARRVGTGARGLEPSPHALDLTTGGDRLLGRREALAVLGVAPEQFDAMLNADLLVARGHVDGAPVYAESDLMSVRLVGG